VLIPSLSIQKAQLSAGHQDIASSCGRAVQRAQVPGGDAGNAADQVRVGDYGRRHFEPEFFGRTFVNLPVHPRWSLMLQAFTGVSKVEKAQRNRCQTSPSKNSDNKANKTNRQQKMEK
jgi:hypothetical protein